jgi:hypothetical protein
MSRRYSPVHKGGPDKLGQGQKTQGVSYCSPVLSNSFGHLFLGIAVENLKIPIRLGLLNRVEVLALDIFDESKFQPVFILDTAYQDRNLIEARHTAGSQTTLTSHQFVAPRHTADQQWLQNPLFPYGGCQFLQRPLFKTAPGLPRAGENLIQGNVGQLPVHSTPFYGRDKGAESFTQGLSFTLGCH